MTDRRTVAVPVYPFHFWLYFQLLRGDFVDQAFVLNDYPDWDHRSTAFRQLFPTFKRCMFPVSQRSSFTFFVLMFLFKHCHT